MRMTYDKWWSHYMAPLGAPYRPPPAGGASMVGRGPTWGALPRRFELHVHTGGLVNTVSAAMPELRAARDAVRARIFTGRRRPPWLRGIGIGGPPGSPPGVEVTVNDLVPGIFARVPRSVDGVPVYVTPVGDIVAQTHTGAISDVRPSVLTAWRTFNAPLEGVLTFMYTDAEGYVTTGMGNLVDPVGLALALPWKNPDGSLADSGTVQAQWEAVKSGPINSSVNAGYLTTIRLDSDGIQQAIATTLGQDAGQTRAYFANWDTMPADAQLAILSMDWAMGSGFAPTFPAFTAAINAGQYDVAASNADFRGVGVQNRIAANKFALHNAQIVSDQGLDADTLYWPNVASAALSGSENGVGYYLGMAALVLGVGIVVVGGGALAWSYWTGKSLTLPALAHMLPAWA